MEGYSPITMNFNCLLKKYNRTLPLSWELTKYRKLKKPIRHNYNWFQTLVEATETILFIKQDTQLYYINSVAELITGYTKEEFFNQPDINELIQKYWHSCQSNQFPYSELKNFKHHQEIKIITKNGDECWLDCYVQTIKFKGKLAVMGTAFNITQYKKAEAKIRETLEKAKEFIELQTNFVSIISHEIRVPMHNISFSASLLKRYGQQCTDLEKFEYINFIETSVDQLNYLLDNARMLVEADIGKHKFEPQLINVVQLCQETINKIQFYDQQQHIISFVNHNICPSAWLDKKLVQPILINLLSNAIKYSSPGSMINFELYCENENIVFQIEDQGIGIPAISQKQIFEPFYRGQNISNIPGEGIGLAIVKRFVDLHGGTISLISEVGIGTTFTIRLPMKQSLAISEILSVA
ncbi:MAG: PAS domain-containing sensor histidine kinase [Fischerella sp. CENA71]|nr:PAS domain-containing sensor histidine kinase [Fischerella sp. CENA71]